MKNKKTETDFSQLLWRGVGGEVPKAKGLYAQIQIPDWHIEEVNKRLEDLKNNPDQLLDFDTAMDEIEEEL